MLNREYNKKSENEKIYIKYFTEKRNIFMHKNNEYS